MAGTNLTRLNVALTLTTAAFNRSAAAAQTAVARMGKSIDEIGKSRVFQYGMAAATLSTAAFAYGAKRSAESIDEMAKASDRLGVSMEFLGGLTVLSKDADVSVEMLEKSIHKLNNAVAEAATGSKTAQDALAAFGLTAGQLSGLNTEQRFAAIADASQKMGTSIERNTALMDLFGKEGAALSDAFKDGAKGIENAEKEAEKLGITVSRLDAFKVEEMNHEYDRLGMTVKGAMNNLSIAIAPIATAFARFFNDSAKDTDGFKSQINGLVDTLVKFGSTAANTFHGLRIAWNYITYGVSQLSVGIYSLTDDIIRSAQWWGEAFKRVWDVITTGFKVVQDALSLGWAYLKVPLATFVQYAVGQIGDLVAKTGEMMLRINNSVGTTLLEAGMSARASVASLAANADKDLAAAKVSLTASANASGQAWTAMFSDVKVAGNATVNELLANARRWRDEESESIDALRAQNWYGADFRDFVENARAKAEINAKANADEAAARKASEDAAIAENARKKALKDADAKDAEDHNEMLKMQYQFEADMAQRAADEKIRRQQVLYSETSKFLGNLAVLQQSHDKRLRAIGKVAAKAQIVTSTAVAAMESYKALAGIPVVGPALATAAAAAAIAAGAVQLANVDKGTIGGGGGSTSVSSGGGAGGISESRGPTQTLVVQGDYLTPETLARLFSEAKEKGIQIEGVRRA